MKKIVFILSILSVLVSSCEKNMFNQEEFDKREIERNVYNVFGVNFDKTHDWVSTVNGSVTIGVGIDDAVKVQILSCSPFGGNGCVVLNETDLDGVKSVVLNYDAPSYSKRLYAACITSEGHYFVKGFSVGDKNVDVMPVYSRVRVTRGIYEDMVSLLPEHPMIDRVVDSYNKERGYGGWSGCYLYQLSPSIEADQVLSIDNYTEAFIQDLRDIIFTYLPNKGKNLQKLKESKWYNENSYSLTTGGEPIFIDPIYINDGGYKEVDASNLYYYYFKDSDIEGLDSLSVLQYYKNLPKYKAVQVSRSIGGVNGLRQDSISKKTSYCLIYWGDGIPSVGTEGAYVFPKGYKIGFMLRVEHTNKNKRGELYCDGRLNTDVNSYGDFKSAKLGADGARMAWLMANDKYFLSCETGSDSDFNDLIFEIEGGIEPIGEDPDPEKGWYTFCFEDTRIGDYDLNDVVIKAQRVDKTHVRYYLIACGGNDKLYIRNLNGNVLNETTEIHSMFGVGTSTFVNTVDSLPKMPYVTELFDVPETFSFLDKETQPFIYDATNGNIIRLSEAGEDPHGIMLPYNFKYPLEKVCVKNAYLKFNEWGVSKITSTDWYKYPVDEMVYDK